MMRPLRQAKETPPHLEKILQPLVAQASIRTHLLVRLLYLNKTIKTTALRLEMDAVLILQSLSLDNHQH